MKQNKTAVFTLLAAAILLLPSCNDFLEIAPPDNRIGPETLFQEPDAIKALVNDMYITDDGDVGGATSNLLFYLDIAADEVEPSSQPGSYRDLSNNVYDAENDPLGRWSKAYTVIYTANNLLEHLPGAEVLTDSVRRQYQAEARFMRALCYFHLVNLYGGVPLVLTTDPGETISMPRTPADEVWAAIIDDLKEALELAPADFDDPARANQWAIRALLARVHLYRESWEEAETMASEVIEDSPFTWGTDLGQIFLPDSPSAIFVPPVSSTASVYADKVFVFALAYIPLSGNPEMVFRQGLVDAFETGDQRLDEWTATYGSFRAPYKYINGLLVAPRTERFIYMRLAEQYLIRAEARARQGNVTGASSAASDLDVVRSRAGLTGTTAATETDMIDAIIHERRIEMFSEGQRWFDLKRTGRIDAVLGALKSTWEPYKKLFPIPQEELDANPNLEPNW